MPNVLLLLVLMYFGGKKQNPFKVSKVSLLVGNVCLKKKEERFCRLEKQNMLKQRLHYLAFQRQFI